MKKHDKHVLFYCNLYIPLYKSIILLHKLKIHLHLSSFLHLPQYSFPQFECANLQIDHSFPQIECMTLQVFIHLHKSNVRLYKLIIHLHKSNVRLYKLIISFIQIKCSTLQVDSLSTVYLPFNHVCLLQMPFGIKKTLTVFVSCCF